MDPDYWSYLTSMRVEPGMEMPDLPAEEEEQYWEDNQEDEDEEEEEEEEEQYEDSETTLPQVLYGNRGNDVNGIMATRSSPEVVILDTQASEDDEAMVGAPESNGQGSDNDAVKMGVVTGGDNDGDNKGQLSRDEIDGLFCPICLEAWSSGGDHHICCLSCGHIYGLSCIKKWLRRPGSKKCPQCKKKCGMKDIRLLYVTQIVAVDGELQKKAQSLEAKCAKLEKEHADWSKKEEEWKKVEDYMCKQMQFCEERVCKMENRVKDMEHRVLGLSPTNLHCRGQSTSDLDASPKFHLHGCQNKFIMQRAFQVDGARLFDIDSSSQIFVVARRLSGMQGEHVLTKVSLLSDHEKEDIRLPENTRAVKDLRVSPHATLVLLASLGKKLSILSTESNNTILTYNLPAAAWSCSWDVSSSHYVYAGLQNGTVLQFDTRHTRSHVQCFVGLTRNPVHSLHSLSYGSSFNSGIRCVLSASSLGLCQWNFGGGRERPYLIPDSDKQGVCISLACCQSSDDIVATYRPKIETPNDMEITQPTLSTSGQVAQGSHVHYRKMGSTYQKLGATCANVSDIRLPRSAIINGIYQNPAFASEDELVHELVLQELPSLMTVDHLRPQKPPVRDIKFTHLSSSGLLSFLSEDSLHLFTAELL